MKPRKGFTTVGQQKLGVGKAIEVIENRRWLGMRRQGDRVTSQNSECACLRRSASPPQCFWRRGFAQAGNADCGMEKN
jgi:hypothetical protein